MKRGRALKSDGFYIFPTSQPSVSLSLLMDGLNNIINPATLCHCAFSIATYSCTVFILRSMPAPSFECFRKQASSLKLMTKKPLSVASTLIYIKSDPINILRYGVSWVQRNMSSVLILFVNCCVIGWGLKGTGKFRVYAYGFTFKENRV